MRVKLSFLFIVILTTSCGQKELFQEKEELIIEEEFIENNKVLIIPVLQENDALELSNTG